MDGDERAKGRGYERDGVGEGRHRRSGGRSGHHGGGRRAGGVPGADGGRLWGARQPLSPSGRPAGRRAVGRRLPDLPVARLRVPPDDRQPAARVQGCRGCVCGRGARGRPLRGAARRRGAHLADGPAGRRLVRLGPRHRVRHGRPLEPRPGRRPPQGRGGRPDHLHRHPPRGRRRLRRVRVRQGLR